MISFDFYKDKPAKIRGIANQYPEFPTLPTSPDISEIMNEIRLKKSLKIWKLRPKESINWSIQAKYLEAFTIYKIRFKRQQMQCIQSVCWPNILSFILKVY